MHRLGGVYRPGGYTVFEGVKSKFCLYTSINVKSLGFSQYSVQI